MLNPNKRIIIRQTPNPTKIELVSAMGLSRESIPLAASSSDVGANSVISSPGSGLTSKGIWTADSDGVVTTES